SGMPKHSSHSLRLAAVSFTTTPTCSMRLIFMWTRLLRFSSLYHPPRLFPPVQLVYRPQFPGERTMASLTRQPARWVAGLRYEQLPTEVVDRAKGVTLHCLASVLLGAKTAGGKQAVKFITTEEAGVRQGATIMVDGATATRGGAAFANSELALS